MKIKNLKLMLLGLVGLMSATNASAQMPAIGDKCAKGGVTYQATERNMDEQGRADANGIVYNLYTIKWTALEGTDNFTTNEAIVLGVAASTENVATLSIPATMKGGNNKDYDVVEIATEWTHATAAAGSVAMKDVRSLTTSLSVDITNLRTTVINSGTSEAPVWTPQTNQNLPSTIYSEFTKLQSLTITDSYAATAEAHARYTVFTGGFADGTKETLTTASLEGSNIKEIGNNAFKGCIALTGFNFGEKITSIGTSAFQGCYGISELNIPATVTSIGENAFAGMYLAATETTPAKGLKTLIINGADNVYEDGKLKTSKIPAAFADDALLESITIGSTTATSIANGAFTAAEHLKVLDLSGCTALTEQIGGAFANSDAFTSIKLEGNKLKKIGDFAFSNSNRTLAEITFPETLEMLSAKKFQNFVALKVLDLSKTAVTVIPDALFNMLSTVEGQRHKKDAEGNFVYEDGKPVFIEPALTTVVLNKKITSIGEKAFNGCSALATVTDLNNEKLTEIGASAFNGTALTALDLSATKVEAIPALAFGNIATLASIKLPATVAEIATAAFANDSEVASINLQDTKLTVLNPIFHEGIVVEEIPTDETSGDLLPGYTTKEVGIKLATLTLPETLEEIEDGALQLLDVKEINIPASVESVGQYALQGCINLTHFTWNEAKQRTIANNSFRGDDKLQEVKMVTYGDVDAEIPVGIKIVDKKGDDVTGTDKDNIFMGNDKSRLKFIVNAEDEAALLAMGWTEANLKYCTLTSNEASTFKFNEKSKTGEFYNATYYNDKQATWFPEEDFEVYGAVVEGSTVVMKPFTAEGGYYKVAKYNGANTDEAVCIVRSKKQSAAYELKNAKFNDITTAPVENQLEVGPVTASRLNFVFQLGINKKTGSVAFFRVTNGTVKGVYVKNETPADRLDVVFEGEATAIQGINAAENNDGAIYNLNGMRVNKAQKGIYIQNGKKYVVK